jgi:hypothetical protein
MGSGEQMLCLTVWQPWASAIIFGSKDIENRTWTPPKRVIGRRIWIHAGKRLDSEDAIEFCADNGYDWHEHEEHHIFGAIIGSVAVEGWTSSPKENSPWFVGPIGWRLTRPIPQPPVYCRGAQGLWLKT